MVGDRVHWEDLTWNHSAHRPATQSNCSLHLLHVDRVHAPLSFLFLTLLENYGLQLHHLTLHAIMMVAIFIQLCVMYVGVGSLVCLFQLFFTLRA
jgi:hypothetical protein